MQFTAIITLLPIALVAAAPPAAVEERQVASGCYAL